MRLCLLSAAFTFWGMFAVYLRRRQISGVVEKISQATGLVKSGGGARSAVRGTEGFEKKITFSVDMWVILCVYANVLPFPPTFCIFRYFCRHAFCVRAAAWWI